MRLVCIAPIEQNSLIYLDVNYLRIEAVRVHHHGRVVFELVNHHSTHERVLYIKRKFWLPAKIKELKSLLKQKAFCRVS